MEFPQDQNSNGTRPSTHHLSPELFEPDTNTSQHNPILSHSHQSHPSPPLHQLQDPQFQTSHSQQILPYHQYQAAIENTGRVSRSLTLPQQGAANQQNQQQEYQQPQQSKQPQELYPGNGQDQFLLDNACQPTHQHPIPIQPQQQSQLSAPIPKPLTPTPIHPQAPMHSHPQAGMHSQTQAEMQSQAQSDLLNFGPTLQHQIQQEQHQIQQEQQQNMYSAERQQFRDSPAGSKGEPMDIQSDSQGYLTDKQSPKSRVGQLQTANKQGSGGHLQQSTGFSSATGQSGGQGGFWVENNHKLFKYGFKTIKQQSISVANTKPPALIEQQQPASHNISIQQGQKDDQASHEHQRTQQLNSHKHQQIDAHQFGQIDGHVHRQAEGHSSIHEHATPGQNEQRQPSAIRQSHSQQRVWAQAKNDREQTKNDRELSQKDGYSVALQHSYQEQPDQPGPDEEEDKQNQPENSRQLATQLVHPATTAQPATTVHTNHPVHPVTAPQPHTLLQPDSAVTAETNSQHIQHSQYPPQPSKPQEKGQGKGQRKEQERGEVTAGLQAEEWQVVDDSAHSRRQLIPMDIQSISGIPPAALQIPAPMQIQSISGINAAKTQRELTSFDSGLAIHPDSHASLQKHSQPANSLLDQSFIVSSQNTHPSLSPHQFPPPPQHHQTHSQQYEKYSEQHEKLLQQELVHQPKTFSEEQVEQVEQQTDQYQEVRKVVAQHQPNIPPPQSSHEQQRPAHIEVREQREEWVLWDGNQNITAHQVAQFQQRTLIYQPNPIPNNTDGKSMTHDGGEASITRNADGGRTKQAKSLDSDWSRQQKEYVVELTECGEEEKRLQLSIVKNNDIYGDQVALPSVYKKERDLLGGYYDAQPEQPSPNQYSPAFQLQSLPASAENASYPSPPVNNVQAGDKHHQYPQLMERGQPQAFECDSQARPEQSSLYPHHQPQLQNRPSLHPRHQPQFHDGQSQTVTNQRLPHQYNYELQKQQQRQHQQQHQHQHQQQQNQQQFDQHHRLQLQYQKRQHKQLKQQQEEQEEKVQEKRQEEQQEKQEEEQQQKQEQNEDGSVPDYQKQYQQQQPTLESVTQWLRHIHQNPTHDSDEYRFAQFQQAIRSHINLVFIKPNDPIGQAIIQNAHTAIIFVELMVLNSPVPEERTALKKYLAATLSRHVTLNPKVYEQYRSRLWPRKSDRFIIVDEISYRNSPQKRQQQLQKQSREEQLQKQIREEQVKRGEEKVVQLQKQRVEGKQSQTASNYSVEVHEASVGQDQRSIMKSSHRARIKEPRTEMPLKRGAIERIEASSRSRQQETKGMKSELNKNRRLRQTKKRVTLNHPLDPENSRLGLAQTFVTVVDNKGKQVLQRVKVSRRLLEKSRKKEQQRKSLEKEQPPSKRSARIKQEQQQHAALSEAQSPRRVPSRRKTIKRSARKTENQSELLNADYIKSHFQELKIDWQPNQLNGNFLTEADKEIAKMLRDYQLALQQQQRLVLDLETQQGPVFEVQANTQQEEQTPSNALSLRRQQLERQLEENKLRKYRIMEELAEKHIVIEKVIEPDINGHGIYALVKVSNLTAALCGARYFLIPMSKLELCSRQVIDQDITTIKGLVEEHERDNIGLLRPTPNLQHAIEAERTRRSNKLTHNHP